LEYLTKPASAQELLDRLRKIKPNHAGPWFNRHQGAVTVPNGSADRARLMALSKYRAAREDGTHQVDLDCLTPFPPVVVFDRTDGAVNARVIDQTVEPA
jgi:hypothetical protein